MSFRQKQGLSEGKNGYLEVLCIGQYVRVETGFNTECEGVGESGN